MICDFSIRGELKISFNRLSGEVHSIKEKDSKSALAVPYKVAKYAIETWLDVVTKNEADINSSLE
jgi:hypothetical protein